MGLTEKGKKVIIYSCFVFGFILVAIGASFAFQAFNINSTKKHMIKAADMDVILEEDDGKIELLDAYPVYDEVGMIEAPYTFRLINRGGIPTTYFLKLMDVTEVDEKLAYSDVKYGFTKNGNTKIRLLSTILENRNIDYGVIASGETIEYALRLWIKDSVVDRETVGGKSLKFQLKVELTDEPLKMLSSAEQGSYVNYTGANGCSGNACKGANATCMSSYPAKYSGWRVAYTEGNNAYLISGGTPECYNYSVSGDNKGSVVISKLQSISLKYCNPYYVDGNCNSNVWTVNNTDFNKITKQWTKAGGGYLKLTPIAGAIKCYDVVNNVQCGSENPIIDIVAFYYFAERVNANDTGGVMAWRGGNIRKIYSCGYGNAGVRPIIRISSLFYITGGKGTTTEPYQIEKVIGD